MNKIITVGEHKIQLPELTKSSEVLFVNASKKDAYWNREVLLRDYRQIWFDFIPYVTLTDEKSTLYDERGVLVQLSIDDTKYIERIYKQEFRRRTHGVWFKNGDDYEYLTGDHYFLLMWAKMTVIGGKEYAEFRQFQRDFFYLVKKVNESNDALGLFVSKPKKTGVTNIMWSGYYLNKATLYKNQNLGNMNINKDQGAKTFREYFMYSLNGLPAALRPQIKTKREMEGGIDFGRAYSNSKANRLVAVQDTEAELNTSVFCVATAPKAFDVAKMNDTWYDEPPKYKESIEEIFTTNKEAVKMGNFINGRVWMTSYTPDEDSLSFREARKIFLDSKLSTIKDTGTGMTKSEMWCWHIPSYASWIGKDNTCFNKHGRCDEERANNEIDAGRKAAKDNPRTLQALKRQYAKDEREAWSSAGAGSTFDLIRLGELLVDLEIEEENTPDNPYVEGNLVWEIDLWEKGLRNLRKKGEFCNVKFVPLSPDEKLAGKVAPFRMYREVHASNRNLALKQGRDEHGNLLPPPKFLYAMGGDPTKYAGGTEIIQGSKNAMGVISMPDPLMDTRMGEIVTNTFDIEYYARHELPIVDYENYLKLIIYTGCLNIVEGNEPFVATSLMEEGLGHYCIVKDENKIMTIWKPWFGMSEETKNYHLIKVSQNQTGSNEILELMVRLYKNYFNAPPDGEKDYGKTCKTARLIKQMMDLTPKDTKLFDLFMAWGYALIVVAVYQESLMKEKDDTQNPTYYAAVLRNLGWVA